MIIVSMTAARSAPRWEPANVQFRLPRATPRRDLSTALLKGMVPAAPRFGLAFVSCSRHELSTGIGASGARNGGRPS